MKSLIKKADFFPHKATLTFNEKGETGYKTFIGGLITIISILFSIICSSYFILRLFLRKDLTVIYSNEIDPFVNITYSHKLPFLLRLTDTNSLPFEDDDKLYYITASIWHGGTNDTTISYSAKQHSVSFNIGKCDINKHFADEYKEMFKNWTELNTYYCIEPRNSSQTIYGLYGNLYPFSYYSFTFRQCKNTTENNNSCYSYEEMKEKMMPPYLDVVFIDYSINSLDKNDVKQLFIRKERYEISTVLYKRIWLYLDNIIYNIDNGYIFSKKKIENFHSYETISSDFNIFEGAGIFVTLTVLNSIKRSIYNKQYTKAQDYLAIIGGLVKVITLFSNLLNYYNSQNSYYLKIIKDFIIKNKLSENYISKKKNKENKSIKNYKHKDINEKENNSNNNNNNNVILPSLFGKSNLESSVDIFTKNKQTNFNINQNSNKYHKKNLPKVRASFKIINKSFSTKVLPSIFSNKNHYKTMKMYKEFINDRLNVINILKKLEIIDLYSNHSYHKILPISNDLNDSIKHIDKKSKFVDEK